MNAYSLLEYPSSIPRQSSAKRWQLAILLLGGISIISCYMIFARHNNEYRDDILEPIDTQPPSRSINFTVPTQTELYYLDLDRYPIEDNVLRLFAGSKGPIQTVTIDKLLRDSSSSDISSLTTEQQDQKLSSTETWTDKWLVATTESDENTFACDQQLLPYPILRRVVSEYMPVGNPDSFYDVHEEVDFSKPFVVVPFTKQPTLNQGQKVCVRVVVPYQNVGKNDLYRLLYRPYDQNHNQLSSPWWDTMMTTLKNVDTNATLPITMEPWSGHRSVRYNARSLNNVNPQIPEWTRLRDDVIYERERMHIYEANIALPHNGTYELSSLLEFVEARYNFEYGPVSPYNPIKLPVYPVGGETIVVGEKKINEKKSTTTLLLEQHLALPLCNGTDNPGRWLPWPRLNETKQMDYMNASSNYAAKQDLTKIAGLTRDGKYWAPYNCRYRHISYEAFNRCASKKYPRGMALYGDSNIRRSIKKFLSHGQWCKNWEQHIDSPLLPDDQLPHLGDQSLIKRQEQPQNGTYGRPEDYLYSSPSQTRSCYCEDYAEEFWNTEWFHAGTRRFDIVYGNSQEQSMALGLTEWDEKTAKAHNASAPDAIPVNSYKWDGLTYLNDPSWDHAVPASNRLVDIAIFSLGNWDAAFAELGPFSKDVDRLIQQIKDHYDLTKTRIIYRTAQYYCCRIDMSGRTRQVSGPRMEIFDKEAKNKFKKELNATIWDTYTLGESKSWDEKIIAITCSSNHVPADQVEIENQVLMNGLCNNI